MKDPQYTEAIKHGWQIAMQHKVLWFFGVFAALLGQMGIFEILAKFGAVSNQTALSTSWLGPLAFGHVKNVVSALPIPVHSFGWLAFSVILGAGIIIFLAMMAAASQGTIIHATAQSVKGKKTINTEKAWHTGMGHVWKLLLLHIVKIFIFMVLGLFVGWGVYAATLNPAAGDRFIYLGLFILAAVVGMIVSFLIIYAAGYIVVEEYSVGKALSAAWRLFTSHWLVSIEVGLIFIVFNFILVALASLGVVLFYFPVILLGAAALLTSASFLYILGLMLGNIVFFAFVLLVGGLFTTFNICVWTYLFMKMHKTGLKSKVVHWLTQKHA